ncbi:MAG: 50S ribosomal protein L25/general stress protein Ctc [Zoogloeaceae bacterium]|jgi:large subunit ribosomal protein L25|nr:50S ribosomal protein L25/general stress protein Ctc [Zoogloeaceae bacterium]
MQFVLNAQKRAAQGSSASRRLRRAGKVPGILYGQGRPVEMIELDHNQLYLSLKKEAFHASVITIDVEGKKEQALLRDFQVHAYKPLALHVDFLRIDAKEKLRQRVPLHFIHEDTAPGVKTHGGQIVHLIQEVEIECLPADLPSFIEVDLGQLGLGESIHLSQLVAPKGVEVQQHHGDQAVISCVAPRGNAADEAAAAAEGAAAEAAAATENQAS